MYKYQKNLSLIFASLMLCSSSQVAYGNGLSLAFQESLAAQNSPSILTPLEINKPIERDLKAGESNSYSITLKANDYLSLVVEQKGIDVVVRLFSPSGEQLQEVDSPNGDQGDEPVEVILDKDGIYRLEIASLEKNVKPAQYKITIKELRAATDKDIQLSKAKKLNSEAQLLRQNRKYDQALPLATEALEIYKKFLGENHLDTATVANSLALIYFAKADYTKAEPLYLQALEIYRKILGENHLYIATTANNLAQLYYLKADFAKAEPFYLQALSIRTKVLGENHTLTGNTINDLAILYKDKGDYAKAEPLYLKALDISKKVLGENHQSTAGAINNLASFYTEIKGDAAKAEALYLQAVSIHRKVSGENHPNTANAMNNLAILYKDTGNYLKAEPLFLQSLDIFRKTQGESHPDTARAITSLSIFYREKGDYTKAEILASQALDIYKKALGENHPQTTGVINLLASLYVIKGDFVKAESLYLQGLDGRKKTFGENHYLTANAINNLANVYNEKQDYTKAEPLFIKALEIYRKSIGDSHRFIGGAINNLANLYSAKKEYTKAESFYIQALEVRKKTLGDNHPFTTDSINSLALFYQTKGDYEQAIKFHRETNDAREEQLTKTLVLGSERQKQAYLQKYAKETDFTLSLHTQHAPNNPKAIETALTEVLRRKGRSIDVTNQSIEALRKRAKAEDIALLDELTQKKTLLSNLTLGGIGKRTPEQYQQLLKSLQDEVEKLEYKISEKSLEFRTQNQTVKLQSVQNLIPTNSTLIEFASYHPYDAKTKKYSNRRYVVYLLNNEGVPTWSDLGDAEVIDKAVAEFRQALVKQPGKALSNIQKELKPKARTLDKLVMEPVRKLLGDKKHLLIAPDGALNLVPFDAFVDEKGRYLVENYSMSYLTSGRDLLRLQTKIESKSLPVIIANPDYGQGNGPSLSGNQFDALDRLKATEQEASIIKSELKDAVVYLDKEATESKFKELQAPSILHIATHGYFLKDIPEKSNELLEKETRELTYNQDQNSSLNVQELRIANPLLRSYLFFAGANQSNSDGQEDGNVTALEATGVNLFGTKLVVLSACQTGLGDVKNGDGVYGLRRALVLAGSETQMISLWSVNDQSTKDLMVKYYKLLNKNKGRGEALREVQLNFLHSVRKKTVNGQLVKTPAIRSHPYYWACFIQSGEWANLEGKR